MSNSSTGTSQKSTIQDGLRNLLLIVRLLEKEGIRIVTAESCITRQNNVLFSGGYDLFRKWCRKYSLKPEVINKAAEDKYLNWIIRAEYHGVVIQSYMTDMEKEIYDAEAEA